MPKPVTIIVSLVLGAAAAGLVSCGGGDDGEGRLARANADDLLTQLETVQENFDVGSCAVAELEAADLLQQVQELPRAVDPELREALSDGIARLQGLLNEPEACEEETTPTVTEETTTEETETEETETEETETEETTTTTPTTPTTPTVPDENGTGGTPGGGGGSGL